MRATITVDVWCILGVYNFVSCFRCTVNKSKIFRISTLNTPPFFLHFCIYFTTSISYTNTNTTHTPHTHHTHTYPLIMIDSNIIDAFNSSWKVALRHIIVIGYLSTAPGVLSQNSFLQGNSNKVIGGIPYPENTPNPFRKSPQKQDLLVWDEEGKRLSEEFNTGSFYWCVR